MKLIAHRGNINGRFELYENEPTYIDLAIKKGYDVEVDVWYVDKILYLGHDKPDYSVDFRWFCDRIGKLWIHCKNLEAISFFNSNFESYPFNYFWHDNDDVTLTSFNYIWAYPGKQPIKNSIAVLPEIHEDDVSNCIGICSDYVEKYENENC
jgi:hypothetical protein